MHLPNACQLIRGQRGQHVLHVKYISFDTPSFAPISWTSCIRNRSWTSWLKIKASFGTQFAVTNGWFQEWVAETACHVKCHTNVATFGILTRSLNPNLVCILTSNHSWATNVLQDGNRNRKTEHTLGTDEHPNWDGSDLVKNRSRISIFFKFGTQRNISFQKQK